VKWGLESRFTNGGIGTIKEDEREGAEVGAVGEVGCVDVGGFCESAGRQSSGSNDSISSTAMSESRT